MSNRNIIKALTCIIVITGLFSGYTVYAQKTDTIHLRPSGGPMSTWRGGVFKVNDRVYSMSIADGNGDGKITFDSVDYINFNAPLRHQKIAARLDENPSVFKDAENGTCLSIRVMDNAGTIIQYGEVPCNRPIKGTFINSLPSLRIKNFFTGQSVSFDSLATLKSSEKMLLVHFMRLYDFESDTAELHYYATLKTKPVKIILFMRADADKAAVKQLLIKYNIPLDVYTGGDDAVSDAFNEQLQPGSVLFVHNKPIYFEMFGAFDEVLDYLNANAELGK